MAEQPDPEKLREEGQAKLKRMKEAIAAAIMSVARVAHQLKEDTKITPANADQKLSVCGLRLEHMVATLFKKKPTFNIESVNTDYSSDLPPAFLGIKNAIYVSPPATAAEQDPEKELQKFYMERPTAEADEEDDFFSDEYSKRKRLAKALSQQQLLNQQLLRQLAEKGDAKVVLGKALGAFLKEKMLPGEQPQTEAPARQEERFESVLSALKQGKSRPSTE